MVVALAPPWYPKCYCAAANGAEPASKASDRASFHNCMRAKSFLLRNVLRNAPLRTVNGLPGNLPAYPLLRQAVITGFAILNNFLDFLQLFLPIMARG